MKFKFHETRYTFDRGNFSYAADCIKHALEMMGHEEQSKNADLHIYNHTCRDLEPDMEENAIIFKPTAPTSKHFQICRRGYANSSEITFYEPMYDWKKIANEEWDEVQSMIERRANKWDDSIMLKWPDAEDVKDNHILIIGQKPDDETVNGFSFGDHWKKLCMIVEKLNERPNLVIKLHPSEDRKLQMEAKTIEKWKQKGHQILTGYQSIHSVLPKTKVAITENSTAGIECMMHDVPIISYGYPDYHWITKDLRILTRLNEYVDNLGWFNVSSSRKFLLWYINDYLCSDIPSTGRRLERLLSDA